MEMFKLNSKEIKILEEKISNQYPNKLKCNYEVAFSKNCNGICGNISNKKTK